MRERPREEWRPPEAGGAGDAGGQGGAAAAGERYLDAADRAIERALSSDSEAFLRSVRQQGGQ